MSSPLRVKTVRADKGAAASRRPYHHGNLRNALIDAAVALVELHGPEALSLREAARRAGVSQTAPYRHFADRDALVAAVAADGFLMLLEDLAPAADVPIHLREETMSAVYVSFAQANRGRFALMFSHALPWSNEPLNQVRAALADCLKDGLGVLRADAAWARMHGLAALTLAGFTLASYTNGPNS